MSGSVLKEILSKIYTEVRRIIDNGVSDIILYGSYARGDYSEFSDVDVMILVSLTENQIKEIKLLCIFLPSY